MRPRRGSASFENAYRRKRKFLTGMNISHYLKLLFYALCARSNDSIAGHFLIRRPAVFSSADNDCYRGNSRIMRHGADIWLWCESARTQQNKNGCVSSWYGSRPVWHHDSKAVTFAVLGEIVRAIKPTEFANRLLIPCSRHELTVKHYPWPWSRI